MTPFAQLGLTPMEKQAMAAAGRAILSGGRKLLTHSGDLLHGFKSGYGDMFHAGLGLVDDGMQGMVGAIVNRPGMQNVAQHMGNTAALVSIPAGLTYASMKGHGAPPMGPNTLASPPQDPATPPIQPKLDPAQMAAFQKYMDEHRIPDSYHGNRGGDPEHRYPGMLR